MKDLTNLQQNSEISIRELNLKTSLAIAFERTGTETYNFENMNRDVLSEFPNVSNDDITKAIRNGSLGKYGKTYKLCTQDICIWIREFLKSKQSKLNL